MELRCAVKSRKETAVERRRRNEDGSEIHHPGEPEYEDATSYKVKLRHVHGDGDRYPLVFVELQFMNSESAKQFEMHREFNLVLEPI
jgi:hypothetical protein